MVTFRVDQIPDLAGKVILITGGNAGLGKETVLQLAKHNPAEIYIAARNESKSRDAIDFIQSQTSSPIKITFLPLELDSLPSIHNAATSFQQLSTRLDVLLLNAGVMCLPPTKTEAGFEIHMGINHVGHFLLTKLLLPVLLETAKTSSDVRVLTVASSANGMAPGLATMLDTSKLLKCGPWTRYGASKAANVYFASELARRYPQLTSCSLHPGLIKTDLYAEQDKTGNPLLNTAIRIFGPLAFSDVPTGALNGLYVAVGAKKQDLTNGQFYNPVGKKAFTRRSLTRDQEAAKKLWEWTEQELAKAEKTTP